MTDKLKAIVTMKKKPGAKDVYAYQSKTYGGYSPRYYHKKKVK